VLSVPASVLAISLAVGLTVTARLPALAEDILDRSSILIPIRQTNLETRQSDNLRRLSSRCARCTRTAVVHRRRGGRSTRRRQITRQNTVGQAPMLIQIAHFYFRILFLLTSSEEKKELR
jgi:hypothetical protein